MRLPPGFVTPDCRASPIAEICGLDKAQDAYGKVAAGIAGMITDKVSATVNVVSTFARVDGNDFGVSGGVKVAF